MFFGKGENLIGFLFGPYLIDDFSDDLRVKHWQTKYY